MVQDVSLDSGDDDETIIVSPTSTPGMGISPYHRDSEDYFASRRGSYRQNSISMSRQYSGSILTRKDSSGPTPGGHHRRRKPLSRLHTEVLLKMVLQDAQTRLPMYNTTHQEMEIWITPRNWALVSGDAKWS
jgi:hypothetical protein